MRQMRVSAACTAISCRFGRHGACDRMMCTRSVDERTARWSCGGTNTRMTSDSGALISAKSRRSRLASCNVRLNEIVITLEAITKPILMDLVLKPARSLLGHSF